MLRCKCSVRHGNLRRDRNAISVYSHAHYGGRALLMGGVLEIGMRARRVGQMMLVAAQIGYDVGRSA